MDNTIFKFDCKKFICCKKVELSDDENSNKKKKRKKKRQTESRTVTTSSVWNDTYTDGYFKKQTTRNSI